MTPGPQHQTSAAMLERAISGRRSITTADGLRVVRVEPDWWLVQGNPNVSGVYVSVIVDLHHVVYCTCPQGLARVGCEHILAVGELLDEVPPTLIASLRRHSSKNVGV